MLEPIDQVLAWSPPHQMLPSWRRGDEKFNEQMIPNLKYLVFLWLFSDPDDVIHKMPANLPRWPRCARTHAVPGRDAGGEAKLAYSPSGCLCVANNAAINTSLFFQASKTSDSTPGP